MNSKNAAIILFTLISVLFFTGTSVGEPTLTYIFGGPDTQEGKFEDESGYPDMQGWECSDLTYFEARYWHISTFNGEGFSGPPDSNHVLWCGYADYQCNDEPVPGYGNNWSECIDWFGIVPDPSIPTNVRIVCQIKYDLEQYYDNLDFMYASSEPDNGFTGIWTWNGSYNGVVDFYDTFVVFPEDYVGPNLDLVQIRCCVSSNSSGSNEDCLYISSGGACQLDNIQIYFNDQLISETDFEDHLWGLWQRSVFPGVGCFAQIWPLLNDLDPVTDNNTPQVAFIDDGIIVPGTGGTLGVEWTYGPDGYVINRTLYPFWGVYWNNAFVSPAIAVSPDNPSEYDVFLQYDVYEHSAECYWSLVRCRLSTVDIDSVSHEWSDWISINNYTTSFQPIYTTRLYNITEYLTENIDSVTVSLEARYVFGGCYIGSQGTPAPYYDNVVIYAEEQPTEVSSIIEEFSTTFPFPNPFNPSTTIRFTLPGAQSVRVNIYAVDGRHIATLIDEDMSPGPHSVTWNGTDEQGRPAASGTYIYRLEAGEYVESKRMVLVR